MRFSILFAVCGLIALSSTACAQDPVIQLVNPFPNLSFVSPVDLQHAGDGTNLLYMVEQAGIIRSFENDESTASTTTFLDIRGRVASGGETGLLGLAFDPDHETNGYLYVDYTTTGALRTRISRFTRSTVNPDVADPASELILLEVAQPFGNHNAGQIAFGPDGYLYVTMGDGGSGGDPQNHGQRPTTLLGSILRLDVHGGGNPLDCGSGTGAATIPPDNPLVDGTGGNCDEIYAYGLRNTWRMSFDPVTGILWAGDVGQSAREEIDHIEAGGNYGWRKYEGTSCFFPPCDPAGMTFPVWEYSHNSDDFSVAGGYVYRGAAIPELEGLYVYGDLGGQIWSLDTSGPNPVNEEVESVDQAQFCDFGYCLASFGVDADGEIYVLTVAGPIRKIVRVPPTATEEAPIAGVPSLEVVGPNPVRESTTFRVQVPSTGVVSLAVFDLLGREVVRLFEGEIRRNAPHAVPFDAANLRPGTYVVRLVGNGTTAATTVTVAR